MNARRGRAYWRSRRDDHRLRWFEVPEDPDPDDASADDYDRIGMMMNIDALDPAWRALVNEHGFTAVVQVKGRASDVDAAKRMLSERWQQRQWQLAHARY